MQHIFARYVGGSWVDINGIKSVRYHKQVSQTGILKFGNVIAASIEVEYYVGSQSDLVIGEPIRYYQQFDVYETDFTPRATPWTDAIGYFYVDKIEKGKKTVKFTAYDASKQLDVDYSARLLARKNNFPMTVESLLNDISAYTNVNINGMQWTNGVRNALVSYFYVSGITARTLVSSIFELLGLNMSRGISGGDPSIYNCYVSNYSKLTGSRSVQISSSPPQFEEVRYNAEKYVVAPTDQQTYTLNGTTLVPIFYKENGLVVGDDVSDPIDCIKAVRSDGTVLGSYSPNGTENNVFYIKGNIIADNIGAFANSNALSGVWTSVQGMGTAPKVSARLFPFRCPFLAGAITYFVNTDGSILPMPIMNLDWTDQEVYVESYGIATQQYEGYDWQNAENQTNSLSATVNSLKETVGDLSSLTTTDQSDLVSAINEVDGDIGDLSSLTTTDQSDVVSAINELDSDKLDASEVGVTVDKIYAPGTYTVSMPCFGYITSSKKSCDLYFITPFHIRQDSTNPQVLVTALTDCSIRLPQGGYLEANSTDLTSYLVAVGSSPNTPGQRFGGALQVRVTKSTPFVVSATTTEVTNNVPVCGVASVTFTLSYT